MSLAKYVAILASGLVVVLALLVEVLPVDADFMVANPSWNGLSGLARATEASPLASFAELTAPDFTLLLCLPETNYSPAELSALEGFVRQGGSVLLADDFGCGNEVLAGLGLTTRFAGALLLDPLICYKDRALPKISRIEADPLTAGVTSLVLNHATVLTNVPTGAVLAESSSFSFLDQNGNGSLDGREPEGPFPVLAREELGGGEVIILSDPSLLINGTISLMDNLRLVNNIAGLRGGKLALDESHLRPTSLTESKGDLGRLLAMLRQPFATAVLLLAALAFVALLARPAARRQRKE